MKQAAIPGLLDVRMQAPAPANPRMPDRIRRGARGAERCALIEKLKDVPCSDCKGRFPSCVMEFDHVHGTKVHAIGDMKYYRLDRLLSELEKCEVVCSNCHAIRTHRRAEEVARG